MHINNNYRYPNVYNDNMVIYNLISWYVSSIIAVIHIWPTKIREKNTQ